MQRCKYCAVQHGLEQTVCSVVLQRCTSGTPTLTSAAAVFDASHYCGGLPAYADTVVKLSKKQRAQQQQEQQLVQYDNSVNNTNNNNNTNSNKKKGKKPFQASHFQLPQGNGQQQQQVFTAGGSSAGK
eukprot:12962-Heterococcus_DN1.PRE.1